LEELKTKAKDEFKNDQLKKMTSKELVEINSKSNALLKSFRDEGKRNMGQAKLDATKTLKFLLGGSDKAFDQFNSKRNELISDAIDASHLFIERGMDEKTAVEKVRSLVAIDPDAGIEIFSAAYFKTMLQKAQSGKLSEDERFKLNAMIRRQVSRRDDN
jgi:hypothetical protein